MVVYVDDMTMVGKRAKCIEQLIRSQKDVTFMDLDTGQSRSSQSTVKLKKFDFTDDGDIKIFIGV